VEIQAAGEVFLASLSAEEKDALRARGTVRNFPRGTALFHERQNADRVLVLLSGCVKLSCLSDDGKEVVLGIRGPGDLLGELSAIDDQPRSATATALEPVEALSVAASDFRAFLGANPRVGLAIMSMLSRRLRDADRKRVEFAADDTMTRVASRIVELSERFGHEASAEVSIDLPISQEELAGWTGCSRDSVVKALQSLRGLGWIETQRRRIVVRDIDALRRHVG
jgi:CRP/FNR family transcriptional regulator, cyclic AMP receptor protein